LPQCSLQPYRRSHQQNIFIFTIMLLLIIITA
jgi:hypothetical protein